MTRSDISLLAVRLLALYLIAEGISYLPGLASLRYADTDWDMTRAVLIMYGVTMVLPLCLGILALLLSRPLARIVTPGAAGDAGPESVSRAGLPDIQAAAIATFGLLLFARSLPHFIRAIGFHRSSGRVDEEVFGFFDDWNLVAETTTLVMGLLLMTGAGSWVRLLRRFRDLGWREPESGAGPGFDP